jgi:hypothetical protein
MRGLWITHTANLQTVFLLGVGALDNVFVVEI